jgi:cytochrome oxidase assembly protein ShyY1
MRRIIRLAGPRVVKRRVLLAAFGLCLVLGFSALGRWQLGRGVEKEAMLAEAAAALAAPARPLGAASVQAGDEALKVSGAGRFLGTPPLWLDNQRRGQRVGVRLYCAFAPEGGTPLLVDLGWLPLAGDRALPSEGCPQGAATLAGLLVPPPAVGLRLGPGLEARDDGARWLAMRLEPAAVAAAWQLPALSPRVLRLDPALPLGHERDLELLANTLSPDKHRGYALQWFGLAAAAAAITLLLWFRKRP